MVLRFIWANVMKDITSKSNTLFVFIDEAAVLLGRSKKKARGYYSVTPIVNKPLTAKKCLFWWQLYQALAQFTNGLIDAKFLLLADHLSAIHQLKLLLYTTIALDIKLWK